MKRYSLASWRAVCGRAEDGSRVRRLLCRERDPCRSGQCSTGAENREKSCAAAIGIAYCRGGAENLLLFRYSCVSPHPVSVTAYVTADAFDAGAPARAPSPLHSCTFARDFLDAYRAIREPSLHTCEIAHVRADMGDATSLTMPHTLHTLLAASTSPWHVCVRLPAVPHVGI